MQELFFIRLRAVHLRQQGKSYAEIQRLTKAPLSTLSYWFRHVTIPKEAKGIIKERKLVANAKARKIARANKRRRYYLENTIF